MLWQIISLDTLRTVPHLKFCFCFRETKVPTNRTVSIFLQINKNGVRKFAYVCFSTLRLVRFPVELEASVEAAR